MKSYGKELPTLTFIHHIRGSYQEDPRKKRLEEWELRKDNTQISKGGHRKKNVAYAVRLAITGTIAQINMWMSRLHHLLKLH